MLGAGDNVMYTLRPKDMQKASEMFGLDMALLERMNAQRLLNATYIRYLLIRADYERLTSGLHWLEHDDKRKYQFPEVQRALRREYNLSSDALQRILRGRNEAMIFCSKCGVRISKGTSRRTGGLCSNCYADTLEL